MVGQLDLKVDKRGVTAYEQTLFPVRAQEVPPDPQIAIAIADARNSQAGSSFWGAGSGSRNELLF